MKTSTASSNLMKNQDRLSMATSSASSSTTMTNINTCVKCEKAIKEMYVLVVDESMYHEDCLRCSCCDARLAELDKLCYQKANMMLCKRDYLRLYGNTGFCAACDSKIQAFEYVMKAKDNIYHLDCFTCHLCKMRFCVGDKFYLNDTNKILCEKDHNIMSTYQTSSSSSTTLNPIVPNDITPSNNNNNNNNNNNLAAWLPIGSNNNSSRLLHHHQHHHYPPASYHHHTNSNKKINAILDRYNNNTTPSTPLYQAPIQHKRSPTSSSSNNHNHQNLHQQSTPLTTMLSLHGNEAAHCSHSNNNNNNNNSLSQRSPNKFEDVSSGYNSPSPTCGFVIN